MPLDVVYNDLKKLEGTGNMQRKSTFEDFEKIMGNTASNPSEEQTESESEHDSPKSKHRKLEFDSEFVRRAARTSDSGQWFGTF